MTWHQTLPFTVKWGNTLSEPFNVSNDERLGRIMSPILFNIYMDNLSTVLNNAFIGCNLNNVYMNNIYHLFYADDSVIF